MSFEKLKNDFEHAAQNNRKKKVDARDKTNSCRRY